MRIGILNTQVPFITGGAERHAASLCKAFRERGFDATEISLPFKWHPANTLADHVRAAKLIDLSEVEGTPVDLAVGLKFPAYLAQHPNKVFWILHQHRQAYDLWESGLSDLLEDPDGAAVRAFIHEEDRQALGVSGTRIYANSFNVAQRLSRFLDLPSTPLYHPPPQAEAMRQGPYGDYLFAPSRMNASKRQMLILEAAAHSAPDTRIIFAGPPDSPQFLQELKDRAKALGVEDRVVWLGAVDNATMVRYYAEARGVVFIPIDEDYGYITLEAMLSGKPVITATDSGGALEFINDGVEGYVVGPHPGSLATAFDRLMQDAALAERMGQAGLVRYNAMELSWDKVVETLTDRVVTRVDPLGADPAALLRHPSRGLGRDSDSTVDEKAPCSASLSVAPVLDIDLEVLKAEIRPPRPDTLPFESIEDLLLAYDFGTYRTAEKPNVKELAPYFGTHWQRYNATLALALQGRTDRVLDIGVFPPFLFQAMLHAARPDSQIDGIWEGPQPFQQTITSLRDDLESFEITLKPANVERHSMPVETGTIDLVLGMEILEHLAIDPLFFVGEAARVLRPGGRIILTTPNVTSHRGMRKMLDGNAPYSFGVFVPTGGVYGRHNREYSPSEVAHLCEAAGFITETLLTADVYDDHIDPEAAALLAGQGTFALRGENILYVGRREEQRPIECPPNLFHGDPRQLSGQLRFVDRDKATGLTWLSVTNSSPVLWNARGKNSVSLFLEWYDEYGNLVHGGCILELSTALDAGQTSKASIRLDPDPVDASEGFVTIELYQVGIGRLAGAGRANVLRQPCSEAAFLRLARGL